VPTSRMWYFIRREGCWFRRDEQESEVLHTGLEKDEMFKIIWLTAAAILLLGWIAYGIWRLKEHIEEQKRPKPKPKHLQQVKKSFDDYVKKMEDFKKPTYKREDEKPGG
jgi:hypothetical protein